MLKDYYNEVIPPWDSRYGKIGHVIKKYDWSNILSGSGRSRKYFIPKELVIHDKITHRGNRILRNPSKGDNYASCNSFANLLYQSCKLTVQEYSDIVIYHINNKLDRPRCANCHEYLIFDNHLNKCYGIFCSESCSMRYWHKHSDAVKQHTIENFLIIGELKQELNPKCIHYYLMVIMMMKYQYTLY